MTLTHKLALATMFATAAAFAQTGTGTAGSPGTGADPGRSGSTMGTTSSSPEARKDAAAAMSPSAVLSLLHQVNQDEIRLGRLAGSKAKNDKVRDFAKEMVDDHTQLDKKLTDWVQKDGKGTITLSSSQLPADTRSHMKSMVDETEQKLNSASGAAFDREYISAMAHAHDSVLTDLDAALPGLKNQDKVYDLVSSARDKVKDHRDRARDILKDLDRSSATGGSGPSGSATSPSSTTQPSGTTGR